MNRLVAILTPLALLAACHSQSADSPAKDTAELPALHLASAISPQDYAAMSTARGRAEDIALIDVRTPEEFAEGHIERATNIDWTGEDFAAQVESLPRDKPYVLYCRSGRRSAEAQEAMAKMGFQNVASMTGGIQAWQQGEMPVVQ